MYSLSITQFSHKDEAHTYIRENFDLLDMYSFALVFTDQKLENVNFETSLAFQMSVPEWLEKVKYLQCGLCYPLKSGMQIYI